MYIVNWLSDIDRYLVTWMPQRKYFVATRIVVFDFELFIGEGLAAILFKTFRKPC